MKKEAELNFEFFEFYHYIGIRNESSIRWNFCPQERNFYGTFIPWNLCSIELSTRATFYCIFDLAKIPTA